MNSSDKKKTGGCPYCGSENVYPEKLKLPSSYDPLLEDKLARREISVREFSGLKSVLTFRCSDCKKKF